MKVTVELYGLPHFGTSNIREVEIPDGVYPATNDILNSVFHNGQNDFQPQRQRSVSVGDVIVLDDSNRYVVMPVGFRQLNDESYAWIKEIDARDPRSLHFELYDLEKKEQGSR